MLSFLHKQQFTQAGNKIVHDTALWHQFKDYISILSMQELTKQNISLHFALLN